MEELKRTAEIKAGGRAMLKAEQNQACGDFDCEELIMNNKRSKLKVKGL